MQFDPFHIYTVDAHTLQVFATCDAFAIRINDNSFQSPRIHERLPRVEPLHVAGFFHDLAGHGRRSLHHGHRHCKIICERHRRARGKPTLRWLVEHHLLMSTTAQRKDIFDPDIVRTLGEQVGDRPARLPLRTDRS